MGSERRLQTLRLLLLFAVAGLSAWFWMTQPPPAAKDPTTPSQTLPEVAMRPPPEQLPGEVILESYGGPSSTVEGDLDGVGRAFENLLLLIKGGDAFRMGANEEFAAALRGQNRTQLRFLPDTHPAFNAAGQIVDRWQTPLFFHVEAADRIDIRSAGPDQEMWTEDDVHRLHSGRFHRGSKLPIPPSQTEPR